PLRRSRLRIWSGSKISAADYRPDRRTRAMNGEPKAARESSEANWKSLEASLAAVEREVKIMAERIRRNVILDLVKYGHDSDERRVIEEVSSRMLRGGQ